ncbi:MAG: hypothetical protein JGK03_08160 [Microcoleus sp. PH2017_25_DOB_D_A]|uniref:hypothetical protein n=1 Tax=unclassified Microcoleus TaxID=2642155 RepID=UPI001D713366|nr:MULTISPECIES: hypothetical protein [unclassified Microcoleus]MCC3534169.1 hypothetical protein [Microcoleus sp. PH2017_25_DOB_D_A]MCC3546500.1 hypothetical protein [Microcoleus sp. PH2017_24_DOB_U_A]TAE41817.1 MAG: hypothetical protein EAZ90_17500 [Oscillatoriales cyanobacterium]
MNTNISPILKVFCFSAALSLAIKYAGPSLSIASTDFNAIIAVLSPSPMVAAILGCRSHQPTLIKPIQENAIALTRNSSPQLPHRFGTLLSIGPLF